MQTIETTEHGFITAARSDCGRITYSRAMAGTGDLMDHTSDRPMWRGLYQGADGYYRDHDRVPADLWVVAVDLMHAVDGHNRAISAAMERRALEREIAWIDSPSRDLEQAMDRAGSDF